MNIYFDIIFITLLLSLAHPSLKAQTNPASTLPESIDGWTKLNGDRIFDTTNLYDYIDGSAELYLSFGFSKVFNRIYSKVEGQEILVDIFYMNSSYDAFGAFSFSVGNIGIDFGNQSQIAPGTIIFWKDNFYVSIFCNPETKESSKVMRRIAELLDGSIAAKGELPEILNFLPQENLNKQSIRYFRNYIWMNSHYFISYDNILNINQNTQGVLAKYGENEKSILMIIKYPDEQSASGAYEKFMVNYENGILREGKIKSKDDKWCGIELVKNFFIGVFNGLKETDVQNLIAQTKDIINNSK
ncbi:MAG: DUF6599 family protein [bacterium]